MYSMETFVLLKPRYMVVYLWYLLSNKLTEIRQKTFAKTWTYSLGLLSATSFSYRCTGPSDPRGSPELVSSRCVHAHGADAPGAWLWCVCMIGYHVWSDASIQTPALDSFNSCGCCCRGCIFCIGMGKLTTVQVDSDTCTVWWEKYQSTGLPCTWGTGLWFNFFPGDIYGYNPYTY
jgi:hypothetical protein